MKRLDYYIIKKFLGTFLLSIALIIIIVIVFDWSEKITDFVSNKAPIKAIIFDYYVNFIPYFVNMFSSLFVFISVIYFTTRMAAKNEFIALFSAGISTKRVLMPYLITALFLVAVNFYLTNFLIPDVNVTRIKFENKYVYLSNSYNSNSNIHFQYDDSTYFYVSHFDNANSVGYRFTKEVFTIEDGMSSKLVAESAVFRPDSLHPNKWLLYNIFERKLDTLSENIMSKYSDFFEFPIEPDDFAVDQIDPVTLNLPKLNKFIAREKNKGSKAVKIYEYEKHQRLAHPFSMLILTFLGFVFSVRKKKSAMGYNLAFGLATGFMFIVFLQFSRVFAVANVIPTWLAAWCPILIFTALSLCFIKNIQR